jgi:uncharacterized membrane protein
MIHLLTILTIVSLGLLIGTEFAVSVFVNPVLWKLDHSAQAAAIRMFARKLGTAMPFWYVGSLVLLACGWFLGHHEAQRWLLSGATLIWVAVIVLTLLFLVPINNRMMQLDPGSFALESRREHHNWDAMHRARVAALTVAFVCFLAASVR